MHLCCFATAMISLMGYTCDNCEDKGFRSTAAQLACKPEATRVLLPRLHSTDGVHANLQETRAPRIARLTARACSTTFIVCVHRLCQ